MTRTSLLVVSLTTLIAVGAAATGLSQGRAAMSEARDRDAYSEGTSCSSCTLRHQRLKRLPARSD